mmetsp:Transcript_37054/g.58725  ORF Transcript_37054/g.58725 Transcript_37054/m.58725 type:complete len:113 (+) Transcript_37054:196-534(+)
MHSKQAIPRNCCLGPIYCLIRTKATTDNKVMKVTATANTIPDQATKAVLLFCNKCLCRMVVVVPVTVVMVVVVTVVPLIDSDTFAGTTGAGVPPPSSSSPHSNGRGSQRQAL